MKPSKRLTGEFALAELLTNAPVVYNLRTNIWTLRDELPLRIGGADVCIPAGETSNLSSTPRPVWWVIAPHELGVEPPFAHDKLYEYRGKLPREWFRSPYRTFTRAEADWELRELALRYGAREWQANLAYRSLRSVWWLPDAIGLTRWRFDDA